MRYNVEENNIKCETTSEGNVVEQGQPEIRLDNQIDPAELLA